MLTKKDKGVMAGLGRKLRKRIDLMCKACIYDPHPGSGGTWRQQVEACRSEETCPLWPVRPRPRPRKEINQEGE